MKPLTSLAEMIGNTPLLRIPSLSKLTGCDILVKCEFLNPGGSVKDRPAKQIVMDAIEAGKLKPGMTIVEGTAGNTGIGLAIVAKHYGLKMLAVMPDDQAKEKEKMLELFGAKLHLTKAVPFRDERHFFHTAKRIAEEDPEKYWFSNQFENLSNFKAHYTTTGPEIVKQTGGKLDALVSASGSAGTISGTTRYLKENIPGVQCFLVDPAGSGLTNYVYTGEFKAPGSSITEGIGIMRLVNNFKQCINYLDGAFYKFDQDVITIARYVRDQDGLVVGSSSALNLAGAMQVAATLGPGKRIVTFLCDLGERSFSKLYNDEYLIKERKLDPSQIDVKPIWDRYKTEEIKKRTPQKVEPVDFQALGK